MNKIKIRVNFYQCDPAGILFFGNIFQISHTALEELINRFQLKENYFQNDAYLVPLIHCSADYKEMIKFNEKLEIKISVSKLLVHSMELEYEIFSGSRLKALVKTVHVFIDKDNHTKIEIPMEIRQKLKGLLKL